MVVAATAATAVAAAFAVVLTGAWAGPDDAAASAPLATTSHGHGASVPAPPEAPLRAGERFVTLRMPTAYTPKAPAAPGTDDYRCFLLDPGLTAKSVVTGVNVLPGNPDVVHHVILFRVPADKVARAEEMDRLQIGQGWTCFGGTGVESQGAGLDGAPWLGAWAPGGGERVLAPDLGMPVEAGSRIVMQVHYNLLAGQVPDRSAAKLRVAADDGARKTLQTVLLPAPVEVPCRPGHPGPLCSRKAAMADVRQRFGVAAGITGDALHLLCPGNDPGDTQSCTRPVTQPETIRAVAGHMHLLGTKISVTVNQGRADERRILDIPVWDFDDQGSRAVQPAVAVGPGDTLTVSCTHDQRLRDVLPSFEGMPERYVVWGEGTTDEMCLGIVMVTRP
jgi:copper type II ascorbate-dependent monooxygenase-like protein